MKSVLEIAAALWALCCIGCSAEPPQTVTLGTLLREMTSADETTRWPEPVSYTHLDVYKRQD